MEIYKRIGALLLAFLMIFTMIPVEISEAASPVNEFYFQVLNSKDKVYINEKDMDLHFVLYYKEKAEDAFDLEGDWIAGETKTSANGLVSFKVPYSGQTEPKFLKDGFYKLVINEFKNLEDGIDFPAVGKVETGWSFEFQVKDGKILSQNGRDGSKGNPFSLIIQPEDDYHLFTHNIVNYDKIPGIENVLLFPTAINNTMMSPGNALKVYNGHSVEMGLLVPAGYEVQIKYDEVKSNGLLKKKVEMNYLLDKITEDTTVNFVSVKQDIRIEENLLGHKDESGIYGILDASNKGLKYYGFLENDKTRTLLEGSGNKVSSDGSIRFEGDFSEDYKISYYLIDENNFYSKLGTLSGQKKAIVKSLEEVSSGDKVIKGILKDDYTKEDSLFVEVYKIVEGKREENPTAVVRQKPKDNEKNGKLTVHADKSFEFSYDDFKFTSGEEYLFVVAQGEDYRSEIPFTVDPNKGIVEKLTERLSGKDRFNTALEIAKKAYPKIETLILASGISTADALAAGPLAGELEAPILLTSGNHITPSFNNYLKSAGVKKIVIIGGEAVISKNDGLF